MIAWRVPEIMALLPILLEISLILFLVGLIDFLLLLQSTVAAIVTSLITVALLCYVAATVAPAISRHCPFRSPKSWLLVRLQRKITRWTRLWTWKATPLLERDSLSNWRQRFPKFANWCELDNIAVRENQHELDLKAMSWIHTTFVDYDVQNSLVDVVPELEPDHAMTLVITILTREVPLTPAVLIKSIRDRTSGLMLLDVGARLEKEPLSRIVRMLLKLLKHLPRDHDPTKLGALDVIWTLWYLGLGATKGASQDRHLFQAMLDNLAELLHEGEPFRLRRAAISVLYESSCVIVWPYRYCPPGESRSRIMVATLRR